MEDVRRVSATVEEHLRLAGAVPDDAAELALILQHDDDVLARVKGEGHATTRVRPVVHSPRFCALW